MATRKPRAKPQLNEEKLQPRRGRYFVPRRQRPRYDGDQIRAELQHYDRKPFMDLLAEWIGSAPDPETIDEFANKHPDKYITALSSLARIAGFTEKTETSVDITVNYRSLSDSQLEDRMAQLQRELGMHTKVINHQPADAERDELLSSKSDAAEDPS